MLAVMLGSSAAHATPISDTPPVLPALPGADRPSGLPVPGAPGAKVPGKAAAASEAPVFAGYLVCVNGSVFADFTDPDGDDTHLNVRMLALRRSTQTWDATWMVRAGNSGVFFYVNAADVLIDTKDVTLYLLQAQDQTSTWSSYTFANGHADGSCTLR
jgi:hypothetical protein